MQGTLRREDICADNVIDWGERLISVRTLFDMRFWILLIAAFLTLTAPVCPRGQREDSLDAAAQLIEEKRYNDAILVLAEIMREEPDKFDAAQDLINVVRKERGRYNDTYEELITVYSREELDMDRAYELFEELEDLDADPDEASVAAYEEARETAVFVFNNKRFQRIMEEAKDQLDQNDYSGAVETYLTGFDLQLEDFETAEYEGQVKNSLVEAREAIREAGRSFVRIENGSGLVITPLVAAITAVRMEEIGTRFSAYEDLIDSAARPRRTAADSSAYIREQNRQIAETREKEEFHLTYLYLLTHGRSDVGWKEGILGAIDLFYKSTVDTLGGALLAEYDEIDTRAKDELGAGNFAETEDMYEAAYELAVEQVQNLSLWSSRLYLDDDYGLMNDEWNSVRERAGDFLEASAKAKAAERLSVIAPEMDQVKTLRGAVDDRESIGELTDSRQTLQSVLEAVRDISGVWSERFEGYTALLGEYPGAEAAADTAESLLEEVRNFNAYTVETERATVTRIADLTLEPLYTRFEVQRETTEEGRRLLEGYEKSIGEGETANTIRAKDPAEARELFTSALTSIEEIRGEAADFVGYMEDQQGYIREGERVEERTERGRELVRLIDALDQSLASLIRESDEQVLLAGRYENEAFYRIEQARGALAENRFEDAREELKAAGDRFDRSLAIQEDPELRGRRDSLIESLNEEINSTENNIIITEVRDLIEEAKTSYSREQYQEAERLLLRAQSRWGVTHVDTKPEIDYWLQLVRVALYIRSGREIAETDPLYAEMSQLLNLARENFLTGKRLVENGRRQEALPYFEEAEKNILYVRMAFPLNQEASVLSLRILRYKDLENFEQLFRNRFNEARSQLSTNPEQAYIDLKDLQIINPDYPGIDQAIYDAEIRLGMRIPPPDPQDVRQADDLYRRALSIVQGNVRGQFPIALEFLNRAIELTPESQRIISLLDRVETEIGGRTTTVLSNAAQQQYRLAEEYFIDGRYFEALRVVNQLLQDEANRQYPPLLELKRRIESNI